MVFAGWHTGNRHSFLSGASAPDEHRTALHAGGGGRQPQLAHAHTAPRSGARHRFGLPLRRRSSWREVFGPASLPYPATYRPRPGSRRFVQHLGAWYAQAHPTEDFAETFAVWVKPRSAWRREYRDWPAYAKLEYIDSLVEEIGPSRPPVQDRGTIEEVRHETRTLREHYARRLARVPVARRSGADELLLKVFTAAPRNRSRPKAASVLRELRHPLRQRILRSGAFSEYLVHQVLRLMIERCEALDLYLRGSRRDLRAHLLWVIARLAESYEERQLPRLSL